MNPTEHALANAAFDSSKWNVDVVQKLWGFCHTLRHDGIDYGDYIEQITYLLFLKMADERAVEVPKGCGCSLTLQHQGSVVNATMSADDCARLGAWITSSELIGAVKRDVTCPYGGGNLDVLDLQTSTASTSYKAPHDCTDKPWADHGACIDYLVGKYW